MAHTTTAARNAQGRVETDLPERDALLLAASHDLRTPLTVAKARGELMRRHLDGRDGLDADWLIAQLDSTQAATQRMVSIVDDLLAASAPQSSGSINLRQDTVDACVAVRIAADLVADYYAPRPHAPVYLHTPAPCYVLADRARLERALENIIGNAVKYSPDNRPIEVAVREDDAWIVITVQDQGIGIAVADLPRVFTPFYRGSGTDGLPGIGLGLAGAKATVEQHGGHITLESTVGHGTCVTVSLPRADRPVRVYSIDGKQP